MKKFKIGFIGSGRIVGHHLKAIKKNKNFTPKAICDLIIKKTDIYSKKSIHQKWPLKIKQTCHRR